MVVVKESYLKYQVEHDGREWVATVVGGAGWLAHMRGRGYSPVTAIDDLLEALSAVLDWM